MKTAILQGPASSTDFHQRYRSALRDYVLHRQESALLDAYERGREAIATRTTLIEIISLFNDSVTALIAAEKRADRHNDMMIAASQFLTETLAPYEMANRGFRDAVTALRRFNETLEDEIKRIAHAVHDDAGQLLVAVHLALAGLSHELPPSQREKVGNIEHLLDQVEKQLRCYSHELRPTILDDLGWIPAIRSLAGAVSKRINIPIEVKTKIVRRLPNTVEIALYRIVQEALNNISKHAKASRASIEIFRSDGGLCCMVQDDGTGFDVHAVQSDPWRKGLGLLGLQERANSIQGTLVIDSSPGHGTKLLIKLPFN